MSLGAPLARLARDVEGFVDDWPGAAADLVARAVSAELAGAPGGGRVSGVGAATVEVEARGSGEATVSGVGSLWPWYETGTRAHVVVGRPLLSTPYGPRPRVRVRGWAARHCWSNGVDRADPAVMADADARLARLGA